MKASKERHTANQPRVSLSKILAGPSLTHALMENQRDLTKHPVFADKNTRWRRFGEVNDAQTCPNKKARVCGRIPSLFNASNALSLMEKRGAFDCKSGLKTKNAYNILQNI